MTLHVRPPATELTPLFDNRTGVRLEIVVPVKNEQDRVLDFINYYHAYDVVFLDGSSDDSTIDIIRSARQTAFRRSGRDCVGENHYVLYHNFLSRSRYTLYMMIDEFVDLKDIGRVSSHLSMPNTRVFVDKSDFLYGYNLNLNPPSVKGGMPRGAGFSTVVYDDMKLHNSLAFHDSPGAQYLTLTVPLLHLQRGSVASEFGKLGCYSLTQVSQISLSPFPILAWSKQFLSPLILEILWRFWMRKIPFHVRIYYVIWLSSFLVISLLAFIEQKYSLQKLQLKIYSKYYISEFRQL